MWNLLAKRIIACKIVVFLAGILVSGPHLYGQTNKLTWPPVTKQQKPWARWWWQGNAVDSSNLTWMMEEYRKVGLGGLEITPIYGVKGYERRFIDFLSPKWMDRVAFVLKEAKRLDLGIDLAQASGWPFGGPWVDEGSASKYVAVKRYSLSTGKRRLTDTIQFTEKTILRSVGKNTPTNVKDPIMANTNLQELAIDQVRFKRTLPLKLLMGYSTKNAVVNLTSKVRPDGVLDWTAPDGDWTLYGVFEGLHGKMVERAGPGGEGYVIDHFSSDATEKYLHHFDELAQATRFSSIRSFFNDSYEVDDAYGEANWTPQFFDQFLKYRKYDLRNHLPALFAQDNKELNERVLCDYRETISDLLHDKYVGVWYEWAHKRGKLIRNQAHGSPANILDLYEAVDIPEIEGTDIYRIKFASSAANVSGKKLVSAEAATWESEHFISTLAGVKRALDLFFVGGVNHIFYHGANYTPKNAPWPGWLFYAAVHFSPNNPFWNHFSKLNNYVTRVQSLLQDGASNNDVLLYLPIYDAFSKPSPSLLTHFDGIERGFKGSVFEEGATEMQQLGYSYDYISDKQIAKLKTRDGLVLTNDLSYKTIVIPSPTYIPLHTFQKLMDLANEGAVVVFQGHLPQQVPGLYNWEDSTKAMKLLQEKLHFMEIGQGNVKRGTVGKGFFLMGADLKKILPIARVKREQLVDEGLQFVRRKHTQGYYYFISNTRKQLYTGWIGLAKEASSVAIFNPMKEEAGFASARSGANGKEFFIHLEAGESCLLKTYFNPVAGKPYPYFKPLGGSYKIEGSWELQFIAGGPELPKTIKTTTLQSWTEMGEQSAKSFSGTAKYTVSFEAPQERGADAWILDLGNVQETASVSVNGKNMGTLIGPEYKVIVPSNVLQKKNILEVEVANSMANRIIDLDRRGVEWKFFYNINMPARLKENEDEPGLFTAKNWKIKKSGLLGPVTFTAVRYDKP